MDALRKLFIKSSDQDGEPDTSSQRHAGQLSSSSTPTVPAVGPIVPATVDKEVMDKTRQAVFEIPGPYMRFAQECLKLQKAIPHDQKLRMTVALTTLDMRSSDLVRTLRTEHAAALENFKGQVGQARVDKEKEEIGTREAKLAQLAAEKQTIQSQIQTLQESLRKNDESVSSIQAEITEHRAQIEARSRTYESAINLVSQELAQTVSVLETLQ